MLKTNAQNAHDKLAPPPPPEKEMGLFAKIAAGTVGLGWIVVEALAMGPVSRSDPNKPSNWGGKWFWLSLAGVTAGTIGVSAYRSHHEKKTQEKRDRAARAAFESYVGLPPGSNDAPSQWRSKIMAEKETALSADISSPSL